MRNLFSDLFKYRESPTTSPLENFTTEILKHLLIRYPNILIDFFLKGVVEDINESGLNIDSQVKLNEKSIADLLITDYETFAVIIENKINADFQKDQITRYKTYSRLYEHNSVIALIVHPYDFQDIGVPDKIVYWSEFAKFIENYPSIGQEDKSFIKEFLTYLKEHNMALTKVKWPLVDGLREKQNFLNMVRNVLEKYVHDGAIQKMAGGSHGEDYDNYPYKYKNFNLALAFIHSGAKFYFLLFDPERKYETLGKFDHWQGYSVVDVFDLNTRHFFPLEAHEQAIEIQKYFETCFKKIDEVILQAKIPE